MKKLTLLIAVFFIVTTSYTQVNIPDSLGGSTPIYHLNGNVGIGTDNPNSKLEVLGDINLTGNLLKNGSPSSVLNITDKDISRWDSVYIWGNHSLAGYLTNYTEIDPVFTTHLSSNITGSDTANWNTAFSWGNHALAGYIDEIFLNEKNYLSFDIENNVQLLGGIKDKNGDIGTAGQVLSSTGNEVAWIDAGAQGQWKDNNGVLSPISLNVSKLTINKDVDYGFTHFKVQNNNETSNYAGAIFIAKGSGPEYTNNMYFGKYSQNFYISSWQGNGVISTDKDLVFASVGSTDATNPNPDPRIIFQTGGTYQSPEFSITRMVLDENGNLGIGTTTPDQKLTVKGKIHSEEVLIDLNLAAPDYVFEKDYPIKDIEEIETYINENKHLPEIPSAAEIKESGLKVGEMNMLLLKKIEELTLYLIEQNKRLNKIETENKELRTEMKELKK